MSKINVITRTSGRPNGFKRNRESILSQTYKDVNHIVCVDENGSIQYVEDNGYSELVVVDGKEFRNKFKPEKAQKATYMPHNLYMHECHKAVKEGWIMYVDDDDMLADNNVLQTLAEKAEENGEDTVLFFQMKYDGGANPVPESLNIDRPPKMGNIGGSCFMIHSKWISLLVWDGFQAADFRVVKNIWDNIPSYVFLDTVVVSVHGIGGGKRNDL